MSPVAEEWELLGLARALVMRSDAAAVGLWPRAAALLARQALEGGLRALWRAREPGVVDATFRAQLACLPGYLRDDALAADVAFTWAVLSEACHHRAYDIGPTAQELRRRFETVERLLERVSA